MSAQTNISNTLSAKAHNVLFAIQGLIWAISALHGDLATILTNVESWTPMIAGVIHLIYHERQVVKDAYNSGESSTIWDTATQLSTVLASSSSDLNAIKAAAQKVVQAAQVQ